MKVFISWSGEPSRQIALAIREWLPVVLQAVDLYMSEQDNEPGARWTEEISGQLSNSHFGIVCLTPSNVKAPWLNLEAGALGKALERSRVVPLLYQLSNADVAPPLSLFQMKPVDKSGIWETVVALNRHMERPLEATVLARVFELAWPDLNALLANVIDQSEDVPPQRSDRELLEEILELLRRRETYAGGSKVYDSGDSYLNHCLKQLAGAKGGGPCGRAAP
jgi:DNA-binding PucR family transcriptional regulator